MKRLRCALLLLLITPLLLHSCRKKDPCEDVTQTSAWFNFQATLDGYLPAQNYHWYNVTRIYGAGLVHFDVADKSCDSVWWTVGNDPRTFREKNFGLRFGDLGTYEVTCIVYNSKSVKCHGDDGYDTVVRSIELLPYDQSPARGKYRGYFSNDPNKTLRDIRIDVDTSVLVSRLYLLDFPDTSCHYETLYGSKYILEVYGAFVHDHKISHPAAGYGMPGTITCDVLNRTGYANPKVIDDAAIIRWSDDYRQIEIKYWQRDNPAPSPNNFTLQEVKFIGERVQ